MTNFEKWKKELEKIDDGIAVVNGKPRACYRLDCNNCDFGNNCGDLTLMKWAASEYKEPKEYPNITRFEYELLKKYYEMEYTYIARNKDEVIAGYTDKPFKYPNNGIWYNPGLCGNHSRRLGFNEDFEFVKWENKEPWCIKDLLDNCKVEG